VKEEPDINFSTAHVRIGLWLEGVCPGDLTASYVRDGCQRIISNRVELQSPYRSSLHLPREDQRPTSLADFIYRVIFVNTPYILK
jgi:hypothetical protein